jgi:hypothetical protein
VVDCELDCGVEGQGVGHAGLVDDEKRRRSDPRRPVLKSAVSQRPGQCRLVAQWHNRLQETLAQRRFGEIVLSTLPPRRRSPARFDRQYRSKERSPRQIPGIRAAMFFRVPESTTFGGRVLRRSPPWRPILADVLPHEEVRDAEEPEPHEDQYGQGHCGGYPDAKFVTRFESFLAG